MDNFIQPPAGIKQPGDEQILQTDDADKDDRRKQTLKDILEVLLDLQRGTQISSSGLSRRVYQMRLLLMIGHPDSETTPQAPAPAKSDEKSRNQFGISIASEPHEGKYFKSDLPSLSRNKAKLDDKFSEFAQYGSSSF